MIILYENRQTIILKTYGSVERDRILRKAEDQRINTLTNDSLHDFTTSVKKCDLGIRHVILTGIASHLESINLSLSDGFSSMELLQDLHKIKRKGSLLRGNPS